MVKDKQSNLLLISLILFLVAFFGFTFWFVTSQKPSLPAPTFSPSPTPSPTSSPAPEKEISFSEKSSTFRISGGGGPPHFLEISFDPFSAKGGERQKLIIVLEDETEISKVWAKVEDGIGERNVDLTFVKKEDSKTFWQGRWEIRLTKEREYPITFLAKNEKGEENQITLLWQAKEGGKLEEQGLIDLLRYGFKNLRQRLFSQEVLADWMNPASCTSAGHFPHSGSCTLNASIALSGITGIDGGSLNMASGNTLQLNADTTFVFNAGQSLFPIGSIALNANNAQIIKNLLWMRDSDADGCGVFTTPSNDNTTGQVRYGSSSPGTDWRRVQDLQYYSDPNDASAGSPSGCVAATCSVSLSANPSSGTAPLNGVDLTATVSGTATGNIQYRFDCTNDGTWESDNTVSTNPYTEVDLCDYSSASTYTAKVRVDRGGVSCEGTTTITVTAPPADYPGSCTISTSKTTVNTNETFTITVSASDNDGVTTVYYRKTGGTWQSQSCSGSPSSCSKSWSKSESTAGTYTYEGKLKDKNNNEYACSNTATVTVIVPPVTPDVTSCGRSPHPANIGQTVTFGFCMKGVANTTYYWRHRICLQPNVSLANCTQFHICTGTIVGAGTTARCNSSACSRTFNTAGDYCAGIDLYEDSNYQNILAGCCTCVRVIDYKYVLNQATGLSCDSICSSSSCKAISGHNNPLSYGDPDNQYHYRGLGSFDCNNWNCRTFGGSCSSPISNQNCGADKDKKCSDYTPLWTYCACKL